MQKSFDPDSFSFLFSIENRHFWFRSRNEIIGWAFKNFLNPPATFMEIGCGNGFVLGFLRESFPNTSFYGTDLFSEGLIFARRRVGGDAQLVQMDIGHPAFRCGFDGIGAFDVLEHLEDDKLALRNIYQSLNNRGSLILTVPQHPWLWSATDEYSYHKRRYSKSQLYFKLREVGFKIAIITSFMTLLLPVMVASRFIKRLKKDHDVFSESEISDRLNRLFYKTCVIERFFIESGLSLPVGGSLLAVATKSN